MAGTVVEWQPDRNGFKIVVDDVIETAVVTAIHGAMPPVEDDIIGQGEIIHHSHAWISSGVTGPEIMAKGGVVAANSAAEGMMVSIQRFTKDRVLNGDVHGREFQLFAAARRLVHVAVHGHVFVQAPTCGDVIDQDIPNGIPPNGVVAIPYPSVASPKPHVADDDIVRLQFDGVTGDLIRSKAPDVDTVINAP